MFTGLIECKGIVTRVERIEGGSRLEVYAPEFGRDMAIGDSIAVDGVCLSVAKVIRGAFLADISEETLRRTSLAELRQGTHVNLERALRLSDRLGGHLVTGHVDGVGQLVNRRPAGNSVLYQFRVPDSVLAYVIPKGSVAVDGVSLTVVEPLQDGLTVAVVPHTEESTTLADKPISAKVNVEADMMAKYVKWFVDAYAGPARGADRPEPGPRRSLGDMLKDLTEE